MYRSIVLPRCRFHMGICNPRLQALCHSGYTNHVSVHCLDFRTRLCSIKSSILMASPDSTKSPCPTTRHDAQPESCCCRTSSPRATATFAKRAIKCALNYEAVGGRSWLITCIFNGKMLCYYEITHDHNSPSKNRHITRCSSFYQ